MPVDEPTVAMEVLLLVQIPPVDRSVMVTVEPVHAVAGDGAMVRLVFMVNGADGLPLAITVTE